MLRELRRKNYRRVRFKPWFRKCNYYWRKRGKIDGYIEKYRGAEKLADKKYAAALRRDMIYCLLKYGSYYDEYFLFGFEGRNDEYRSSFITESIRMSYFPRMNSPKNTNMLENKYLTYKKFKDYFKREMMWIKRGSEEKPEVFERFLAFVERHPHFVAKPTYSSLGHGFKIYDIESIESKEAAFALFCSQGVVLEEYIIQDERMARLYPSSVNTLRIPTALIMGESGEEEVYLYNPTLRVGRGGMLVDNTSAGGISVIIDKETGRLATDGADKRGNRYAAHPDTGVEFKGFQIPDWEEAVALVNEVARMVPGNHFCGWDLALFEGRGWCLVEANCNAQMSGMQFVPQIGRKAELEGLIARMKPAVEGVG